MPERSQPYNPETEPGNIDRRRAAAAMHLAGRAMETTVITVPTEHLSYHEKLQAALQAEGALSAARFSDWQSLTKDAEGEAQIHDLHGSRFEVKFDSEPAWAPVNRVESLRLPKRERKETDALRTSKRAVVLSDLQIPYQSQEAIDVALQILRDAKPDKVILVGDMLDLSAWGKYIQRPEFATQTQDAIKQAHQLLATIRKMAPTAQISVLEGNHSARLEKHVLANAQAAYGLKRADQPDGWPVLSVPFLCAFDQLDVEWIPGYPANRTWINKNLQVRHGNLVRSKGNTAVAVAQEERVSTLFGHVHRIETQYLTHHSYDGGRTIGAWSIGCLCKIDGSVPSTRNGYDLSGRPVENFENWQNAIAVVDYEEGDGDFNVQAIHINGFNNHRAVYNGKVYQTPHDRSTTS